MKKLWQWIMYVSVCAILLYSAIRAGSGYTHCNTCGRALVCDHGTP